MMLCTVPPSQERATQVATGSDPISAAVRLQLSSDQRKGHARVPQRAAAAGGSFSTKGRAARARELLTWRGR